MKDRPMLDQDPTTELRSSSRWPWISIAIALVVIVLIVIRFHRSRATSQPTDKGEIVTTVATGETGKTPMTDDSAQPAAVSQEGASQGVGQVKALMGKGELLSAREKAFELAASSEYASERPALEQLLGQIHTNLVFTSAVMPEKTNHVIKAGERLETIAKRYKTTVELLQAGNGITNPTRIRQGDVLRPLVGTFRIEVRRGSHELVVYLNDRFFKRYSVGTGKQDKTPLGSFTVVDRIREPVWWRPDGKQIPFGQPENILGTRWLALKATGATPDVKGYGIHGTWDDASIGKSESAGCVRMRNPEVEELFALIPNGTVVNIVDK